MEKTIIIRNKSTLTSFGTHHNGNCVPIIAIDVNRAFNSGVDTAKGLGCSLASVYNVLEGKQPYVRMYERDENGKKIRFIGTCRLTRVSHAEETVDALMESGRNMRDELAKANAKLATYDSELAEFRAWKAEREAIRKAEETRQMTITKAEAKVARCERIASNAEEKFKMALDRLHKARRELKDLKGEE